GLPGYALFLGAIGVAAGMGTRRRAAAAAPEAAFARALRWPLAAAAFVICLAQFPLELAAPRLMLLSLGALCIAWDGGARCAPLPVGPVGSVGAHSVRPLAIVLMRA